MLSKVLLILRRTEGAVAIALLAAIVTVVLIGTVGRFAGRPVIWTDEVAQAMFVWLSLLAADITLQRRGHFRLDALTSILPRGARAVLDIAVQVLICALLAMLLFYAWKFVQITNLRPLPIVQVPSSFATAALPVGFTLMLITLLEQIKAALGGGDELAPAEIRDVV